MLLSIIMKLSTGRADWLRIAEVIRRDLEQYLLKHNLRALVIGVSGGIDSAVTAALAKEVCDRLGLPLIGRSLTVETNSRTERERAEAVGKAYCWDFRETDLTALYETVRDTIEEGSSGTVDNRVRRGNIKARLRMIYLYNLAQEYRGMVLSTDNRTEYLLGFWTLHGDVGDYTPLYGLWKTEVYALARVLAATEQDMHKREALQACIDGLPTDGLGISVSDVEQLGARDYEEVDDTLADYVKGESLEGNPTVIGKHLASEYKRNNPYVVERKKLGLAD